MKGAVWAGPLPQAWPPDTPFPADVDECSARRGGCPQRCVNTAGSYWCQCWEGHSLSADGTLCVPKGGPPRVAPNPTGKQPWLCLAWGGRQAVDIAVWLSVRHGGGHWNLGGRRWGLPLQGGRMGREDRWVPENWGQVARSLISAKKAEVPHPRGPVCIQRSILEDATPPLATGHYYFWYAL